MQLLCCNTIAAHTPFPAVHLPKPVTSLTDGRFWDVVIPVGVCSSAAPATVPGGAGTDATGFCDDVPYRGHFKLYSPAADWKPFVPLSS